MIQTKTGLGQGFNVMWCQLKHDPLRHQGNHCLLATTFVCTGQPVDNSDINDRQTSQRLLVLLGSLSQRHCLCAQFIHYYQTAHRFRASIHTLQGVKAHVSS